MANQTITLALVAHAEQFNKEMRRAEKSVKDFKDEADDVDSRRFRREMDRSERSTKDLDKGLSGVIRRMLTLNFLLKTMKFTMIYTGIRLLLPLISSLGAATFALVSSLGGFAGLIGAIPAGMGAMISTFGALKFATAGLGESMKVLMSEEADPEELAKAMKKAGPEATRFAGILKDLRKSTEPDRMEARNTIFHQLNHAMEDLEKSGYLRMVIDHFGRMAGVLGDVIDSFATMLSSGGTLRSLDTVLRGSEKSVGSFGRILSMLAEVMIHVAAAAQPLVERVLAAMDSRTRSLLDRVREGVRDGSLQRFFLGGLETAQRFFAYLGMIGRALRNVNDVLNEDGVRDSFLVPLEEQAAAFERYTASIEGQRDILRWFEQSAMVMESFYGFLGRITNVLRDLGEEGDAADALAYFFDRISASEGPLERLFDGLGSLDLMTMVDATIDILNAVADLATLLPVLEPLVEIIGAVARGISWLVGEMAKLPDPVKKVLGTLLALKTAWVVLQTLWYAIVGANLLQRLALGIWKIGNALKVLGAFAMAHPLVALVVLLTGLFIYLWNNSETFRRITTNAFNAVLDAAQRAWDWIQNNWRKLVAAIGPFGWALNHIINNFDSILSTAQRVWSWLTNNWRTLLTVFAPFLRVVVAVVENFQAIERVVTKAMDTVKQKFDDAVKFIRNLPGANLVLGVVGNVAEANSRAVDLLNTGARAVMGTNGDTSAQRGSRRGGGGLAATLAMHAAVDRMTPGSRTITNATKGRWGGSEHHKGRALDLTGSFMGAYSRNLAAMGGGSERHAQGSSPHTHAVFPVAPAAAATGGGGGASGDTMRDLLRSGAGGGGGISIEGPLIGQVVAQSEMDVEQATYRALERIIRERRERA